jgi:hypothetical protein
VPLRLDLAQCAPADRLFRAGHGNTASAGEGGRGAQPGKERREVLYQFVLSLTHRHGLSTVMAGAGPPSMPLLIRRKGLDADLRRHDEKPPPENQIQYVFVL